MSRHLDSEPDVLARVMASQLEKGDTQVIVRKMNVTERPISGPASLTILGHHSQAHAVLGARSARQVAYALLLLANEESGQ